MGVMDDWLRANPLPDSGEAEPPAKPSAKPAASRRRQTANASPKFASVEEEIEHGLAAVREANPGYADPKVIPWGEFIDWVRQHPAEKLPDDKDAET